MSMIIACPACGIKRRLDANSMGLKIQCDCGISFSVSPVFAVPENEGSPTRWMAGKLTGFSTWLSTRVQQPARSTVLAGAVVFVLLAGSAALAAWLMTRGSAATLDPHAQRGDAPIAPFAPGLKPRAPSSSAPPVTKPAEPPPVVVKPREPEPPPQPPPSEKPTPPPPPPAPTPTPVTPPPMPTPVETLRASKLWDAFDLDRDAAAAKYTSQVVEITAPGKVERDAEGRLYFGAQVVQPGSKSPGKMTPQEQHWEANGYPPNVRCYLMPGQAIALADLQGKQDCVLRGVCVGRRDDPHVYMGYVIVLENCQAVKVKD